MQSGLKPTLLNRIRVWWHCFIHLHCSYSEGIMETGRPWTAQETEIGCATCNPAKRNLMEQSIKEVFPDCECGKCQEMRGREKAQPKNRVKEYL